MAAPWILRDPLSLKRALHLRWQTRNGFTVSDSPAFDAETADWFRNRLPSLKTYVEYGSGASTILAGRQGVRTFSMESDPRYAAAVRAALPENAPVTIFDAGIGMTEYWGYPVATRRSEARLERWHNYAVQPLREAQAQGLFPELALVDGRFRVACALAAGQAAQRHSADIDILFDDYAGREYYKWVEDYLGTPKMIGRAAWFRAGSGQSGGQDIGDSIVRRASTDFR